MLCYYNSKSSARASNLVITKGSSVNTVNTVSKRRDWITGREQHIHCVCLVRFDNNLDICSKLGLALNYKGNEANIISSAYLKWGLNCTNYLLGDWSFILYDYQQKVLFIARDQIGSANLFYYFDSGSLVCSDNLALLLKHPKIPRVLNPAAILQNQNGISKDNQTYYKDIFRLLPGHQLTVTDRELKIVNYWLPISGSLIRYKTASEYAEHFLSLYSDAISKRLTQKAGITLSGGLDSTSVAHLAASQYNSELHALTWIPQKSLTKEIQIEGRELSEIVRARTLTSKFNKLIHHEVIGGISGVTQNIENCLTIFSQPEYVNLHIQELYKRAEDLSLDTILTGEWGNISVSFKGNWNLFLKEMIYERSLDKFVSQLHNWKKNNGVGYFKAILKLLLLPKLSSFRGNGNATNILNAEAVYENRHLKMSQSPHLDNFILKNSFPTKSIVMAMRSDYLGKLEQFSNSYGIQSRTPVMDKELLDFCISIPQEQYLSEGQEKSLFKKAFKNKLPDEILFNKNRGLQGGDLIMRYKNDLPSIKSMYNEIQQSPLARYWINLRKIEISLSRLNSAKINPSLFHDVNIVRKGLTLGTFLKRFGDEK